MLIGAHMSIAGGVYKAIEAGIKHKCTAIQMFTKSSNQWRAKPLGDKEKEKFHKLQEKSKILIVAHDSYLINLASPKTDLLKKSREAFLIEMERCEVLRIPYLVMHPGSHVGSGEQEGLDKIVESLDWLHDKTPNYKMMICLETTAGQGTNLGYSFEQLAYLIEKTKINHRLGVCMDTCHIFTAGYDIRTKKAYNNTMKQFGEIVGFDRLKVFHFNDSKKDYETRVDRHEHIGEGFIGEETFGFFLNDKRFKDRPFILETPKGEDGEMDKINLSKLRKLIKK